MNEWLDKLWYVHTMEYCSAMNRNELLMHTTCMNFKGFIQILKIPMQVTTGLYTT